MDTKPAAVAYHDQLAGGWSKRYERGGFRRRAQFIEQRVLPPSLEGQRWLDVGCGSGVFSRALAARGALVYGIDGSAEMIAAAKAETVPSDSAPQFKCLFVDQLAEDAESQTRMPFDGAILLSLLEYVEDPEAILAAAARLVRPGGALIFSVPNSRSATRAAMRLRRSLARLRNGGRSHPGDFLDSSVFSVSARKLAERLSALGLHADRVIDFDPVLPELLWNVLPASLLFVICRL